PLRQHLERVRWARRHHPEDRGDLLVGDALVEEVAHAVDEDAARPLPAQRLVEALGQEPHLTGPARALLAEHGQALVLRRETAVRDTLGVAVLAATRDATTADDRIPGRVRPLDRRHRSPPTRSASAASAGVPVANSPTTAAPTTGCSPTLRASATSTSRREPATLHQSPVSSLADQPPFAPMSRHSSAATPSSRRPA